MPTRLHSNPRPCPVGDCDRTVRPGKLMCPLHWQLVPNVIQSAVYRTWRAWTRTHDDDDWAAYADAREAALASIENR